MNEPEISELKDALEKWLWEDACIGGAHFVADSLTEPESPVIKALTAKDEKIAELEQEIEDLGYEMAEMGSRMGDE